MNKTITVFTPTFNRAYCLPLLYESLLRQSSKDFKWLVVDDGSSDNTKELVQSWINDGKVDIEYAYKENGGMHTAHNTAYELIDTELNVCIDSDDHMSDHAVASILELWEANREKGYAGILGLNSFKDGRIVSSKKFPEGIKSGKYCRLKPDYGIIGDVKFVYKTSIIKQYPPYPVFKGEKFVPLGYTYAFIDEKYDLLFLNKVLCIVEYMEDGSTRNIYRQYYKNPKGFAYSRLQTMKCGFPIIQKFVQAVHFVAESLLGKTSMFKNNDRKILTILAIPLGILLCVYILYLNKK